MMVNTWTIFKLSLCVCVYTHTHKYTHNDNLKMVQVFHMMLITVWSSTTIEHLHTLKFTLVKKLFTALPDCNRTCSLLPRQKTTVIILGTKLANSEYVKSNMQNHALTTYLYAWMTQSLPWLWERLMIMKTTYSMSRKSLNKRLTSGRVLRLRLPTHRTQFALRSSAFVCVRLCASACVCVCPCVSASLPP